MDRADFGAPENASLDAAAFLSSARSILDADGPAPTHGIEALSAFGARPVVADMLLAYCRDSLEDPRLMALVSGNGVICHLDGVDNVGVRIFQRQSQLLYLYGHRYVEVVIDAPEGCVLREFKAVNVSEDTLKLRTPPQSARLDLVAETPGWPGQVIVKRRHDQVFDWGHDSKLRTLKAVLASSLPYELVFDRSGAFQAVLESNFRPGLMQTIIDILANCAEGETAAAQLAAIAEDDDPTVAWCALKGLGQIGSPMARPILERFAASDVDILASAARKALAIEETA